MANSVEPEQTAPIGAVCSGSKLFAFILKLVSNVRQFFAANDFSKRHFQMHFFLGAIRVNYITNLDVMQMIKVQMYIKEHRHQIISKKIINMPKMTRSRWRKHDKLRSFSQIVCYLCVKVGIKISSPWNHILFNLCYFQILALFGTYDLRVLLGSWMPLKRLVQTTIRVIIPPTI